MTIYIKEGCGFKTGCAMQDFGRASKRELINEAKESGPNVTGWIAGDMDSRSGFMRREKVYVSVQKRHTESD